jgi:hypothetical protein
LFILCLLEILAEACWTDLGSAPVFGQIAFVPLIALLAIPLALLLEFVEGRSVRLKISAFVLIILLTVLNLFQTWQFHQGIILKSGMTPSSWFHVFGRTKLTEMEKIRMRTGEPEPAQVLWDNPEFRIKTLAFYDFEDTTAKYKDHLQSTFAKNGKRAFKMDSTARFSPALEVPYSELTRGGQVGARITALVYAPVNSTFSGCNLVITSTHEGKNYFYKLLNLDERNLNPGNWCKVSFEYLAPRDPSPGDKLVSYVWYTGKSTIYIDDLKFELFVPEK